MIDYKPIFYVDVIFSPYHYLVTGYGNLSFKESPGSRYQCKIQKFVSIKFMPVTKY